jgi:hypothetical protein
MIDADVEKKRGEATAVSDEILTSVENGGHLGMNKGRGIPLASY